MSSDLYLQTSQELSRLLTQRYSTSFSWGIRAFPKECRDAIFSIYGFVRLADEIVDTFHASDQQGLLREIKRDVDLAIERGVSVNPLLHAFQKTVNEYQIPRDYIDAFLNSMTMDLTKKRFTSQEYQEYIYGSAEVVGLMCLEVFCGDDKDLFTRLTGPACQLGSAFQKVNFLRDINSDLEDRQRIYFPGLHQISEFDDKLKSGIIAEIESEFAQALDGIKELPFSCRFAVYSVYLYYQQLLRQLKQTSAGHILKQRARVSNVIKAFLLCQSFWRVHVLRSV